MEVGREVAEGGCVALFHTVPVPRIVVPAVNPTSTAANYYLSNLTLALRHSQLIASLRVHHLPADACAQFQDTACITLHGFQCYMHARTRHGVSAIPSGYRSVTTHLEHVDSFDIPCDTLHFQSLAAL